MHDVEAIEHLADFDLVFLIKDFAAIEVFVCLDLTVGKESHDDSEKVLLTLGDVLGIVEGGILVVIEIKLAIDDPHPLTVGIGYVVVIVGFVESLHTLGDFRSVGLLVSVASAITALATSESGGRLFRGLGIGDNGKSQSRENSEGYAFEM